MKKILDLRTPYYHPFSRTLQVFRLFDQILNLTLIDDELY